MGYQNYPERKGIPSPQPVQYTLLENGKVSENFFAKQRKK